MVTAASPLLIKHLVIRDIPIQGIENAILTNGTDKRWIDAA